MMSLDYPRGAMGAGPGSSFFSELWFAGTKQRAERSTGRRGKDRGSNIRPDFGSSSSHSFDDGLGRIWREASVAKPRLGYEDATAVREIE